MCQQVEVAFDQRGFGDDGQRVFALGQHLEDLPRDLPIALDWLVRIGVGAERDRRTAIGWPGQFRAQQLCRIRLGKQLRFEIQARRQVEVAVRRPCIAIDAAMLAAAIGIQRLIKRQVRRGLSLEDTFRVLDRHRGAERWQFFVRRIPAVVEMFARHLLETAFDLQRCATAFCCFMFHE